MANLIKTASWATKLPDDHLRVGISRGTPRRLPAGYRVFRALAPGPWFNSVEIEEYYHLYRTEILGRLDPRLVADALLGLAGGRVPVLLCYEQPIPGQWCHRAMAAEWLAEALGVTVPEFGFESLPQHEHPLMLPQLRRVIASTATPDVGPFTGRTATIAGELHRVVGPDPEKPGMAIIAAGDRRFSTGIETLRRQFGDLSPTIRGRACCLRGLRLRSAALPGEHDAFLVLLLRQMVQHCRCEERSEEAIRGYAKDVCRVALRLLRCPPNLMSRR